MLPNYNESSIHEKSLQGLKPTGRKSSLHRSQRTREAMMLQVRIFISGKSMVQIGGGVEVMKRGLMSLLVCPPQEVSYSLSILTLGLQFLSRFFFFFLGYLEIQKFK